MALSLPLLDRALYGDRDAMAEVIRGLTPIVQARVARLLMRSVDRGGADPRQAVRDLCQDVFVALFERNGHALRSWQPSKGMSLENYVGLIAERRVISTLRSAKRNPWTEDAVEPTALESGVNTASRVSGTIEGRMGHRDLLDRLLDRLVLELSPLGAAVFLMIWVEGKSVAEVSEALDMKANAVHAWRSRLMKKARALREELLSENPVRNDAPAANTPPKGVH